MANKSFGKSRNTSAIFFRNSLIAELLRHTSARLRVGGGFLNGNRRMYSEAELGVQLIERSPRQVMLTPAGGDIVTRARRVLAEVDQMHETGRRTSDPEAGSVRFGIFPTLAPYLLPHVVPNIRARFPRLELLLVEEKTEIILQMLREGRLDCAVLALPLHEDWLDVEFLFDEPFMLAVPAKHPLALHRNLQLNELSEQHLLLLEDGHCLRDQALEVCTLAGAGEKEGFRATSLETLRQMVAAGVGITLLPILAVKPPVAASEYIRLLPFKNPPPTRSLALVWRKSSAMSEFLKKMADVLRDLPEDLLAIPHEPVSKVTKSTNNKKKSART